MPERQGKRLRAALSGTNSPKRPKKKPIACETCHARKIKCSGGQPCTGCLQANRASACAYQTRDRQVKVKQSYIDELVNENERLRESNGNLQQGDTTSRNAVPTSGPSAAGNEEAARNPLLEERAWFVPVTAVEMPIHIGEAADAAFATRFRQALSGVPVDHIPRTDYALDRDLVMLSEAECAWPTPARARFLLETSLHAVCQCYHIVRRSTVRRDMDLALPGDHTHDSLTTCRLWALFALGVLHSTKVPSCGHRFPGLAYFAQASRILRFTSERPGIEYMEVLLLLSLYSFYLNRRHSAYYLTGSAVRIGIIMGLHLNIPEVHSTDREMREHRKRLWWTAYIFDRLWASKMGHPVTIQDDDVEVDRPSSISGTQNHEDFGDHEYLIAGIQLAKLAGRMTASIYSRRRQQGSFSQRVQYALKELTSWVEHMPDHLQIKTESFSKTASDAIISLHLLFNQCVILATRPVLLHALRNHVDFSSTNTTTPRQQVPETASALADACIRCARHSYRLLIRAWTQGSFFVFDYFYTQYLFSAITILAVSDILKGNDGHTDGEDFDIGTELLGELKQNGNFAAIEFCRHVDAMQHSRRRFSSKMGDTAAEGWNLGSGPSRTAVPTDNFDSTTVLTAGMALTEPSLQEFLAQPDLDLSFMDTADLQDNFLPGFGSEYWMTSPS